MHSCQTTLVWKLGRVCLFNAEYQVPANSRVPPPECARLLFGSSNGIGSCKSKDGCCISDQLAHVREVFAFWKSLVSIGLFLFLRVSPLPFPIEPLPSFPPHLPTLLPLLLSLRASCTPSHLSPSSLCLPPPPPSHLALPSPLPPWFPHHPSPFFFAFLHPRLPAPSPHLAHPSPYPHACVPEENTLVTSPPTCVDGMLKAMTRRVLDPRSLPLKKDGRVFDSFCVGGRVAELALRASLGISRGSVVRFAADNNDALGPAPQPFADPSAPQGS